MLGCSISTRLYCFLQNLFTMNVGSAFTILLSFDVTMVMFQETSVTTSSFPRLSLAFLPKSCNGAFSIQFPLTVPMEPISFELKFGSNSELVKKLSITLW